MRFISLLIGLVMLAQGGWQLYGAWRTEQLTDRLTGAILAAEKVDSIDQLKVRYGELDQVRRGLRDRRNALQEETASFERQLDHTLEAIGVRVIKTARWRPVEPAHLDYTEYPEVAAFERRLVVRGTFAEVLDLIRSLEQWPDQPRLRKLIIEPSGPKTVQAGMTIQVLRANPEELDLDILEDTEKAAAKKAVAEREAAARKEAGQ